MRRQTSNPSMPGIMTSSSTTSTRSVSSRSERFLAAVGRQHLEVFRRQAGLEQLDVGQDVINDKNAGGHKAPSLRWDRACPQASPRYRRTVSRNIAIDMGLEM